MGLQFDPMTGKILYLGKEVGQYTFEDGRGRVHIDITYECEAENWILPLSWFDYGLHMLPSREPAPPQPDLVIETGEDSLTDPLPAMRYLTEKEIKAGGYVWSFHKTDADNWPSALHGHDYDKHMKLDVITGAVYDVVTRQHLTNLKSKALEQVRDELRNSKDFVTKTQQLLG
jgi:hypothetical protein